MRALHGNHQAGRITTWSPLLRTNALRRLMSLRNFPAWHDGTVVRFAVAGHSARGYAWLGEDRIIVKWGGKTYLHKEATGDPLEDVERVLRAIE
jgi:hypothetical protein